MRVWNLDGQNLVVRPLGGPLLRPGQVILARVLAIQGDTALLEMMGRRVEVESKAPLQEGITIRLAVRDAADPGRVEMQIVPQPEAQDTEKPAALERQLASVLERLGAVRKPGGENLLERLVEAARQMEVAPARLPALAWLGLRGLPLTPALLQVVAEWQQAPPGSAPAWQELLAALPPERQQQLADLLQALTLRPGEEPARVAELLRQLPARLGLQWEAHLARSAEAAAAPGAPPGGAPPAAPETQNPSALSAGQAAGGEKAAAAPPASVQVAGGEKAAAAPPASVQVAGGQDSAFTPTAGSAEQPVLKQAGFPAAFPETAAAGEGGELPPQAARQQVEAPVRPGQASLPEGADRGTPSPGEPRPEAFQAAREPTGEGLKPFLLTMAAETGGRGEGALAQRLVDQLTHLQLLNLPGPDGNAAQALAGLVQLGGNMLPVYLRVHQEGREKPPDGGQRALVVLLFLTTPRLGVITGRLALQNGLLTCGLAVENEAARRLVEGKLSELRRALADLPFRVEVAPCALRTRGDGAAAWAREFGCPWPPAGTLDMLV